MPLILYAHPFSSYCQKVLVALYQNQIDFDFRLLGPENDSAATELAQLWPLKRFPVLRDGGHTRVEASIIVEHLDLHHRGATRWLPDDPDVALAVRFLDRFFDNYIHTPLQKIVFNALRPEDLRDAFGVTEARTLLDTAYRWLDRYLTGRHWAVTDQPTLADCAGAPALFYADWAHPIADEFPNVQAYRQRLNAWPAFAKAIDGGRPYRDYFPLGAPDRD